jgi:hypothetical protein
LRALGTLVRLVEPFEARVTSKATRKTRRLDELTHRSRTRNERAAIVFACRKPYLKHLGMPCGPEKLGVEYSETCGVCDSFDS